jgi:hypothetical protein
MCTFLSNLETSQVQPQASIKTKTTTVAAPVNECKWYTDRQGNKKRIPCYSSSCGYMR